jgi:hypothetical protein
LWAGERATLLILSSFYQQFCCFESSKVDTHAVDLFLLLQAHFLSRDALQSIAASRADYLDNLADLGFIPRGFARGHRRDGEPDPDVNALNYRVVKAVLCAGFYPNVVRVQVSVNCVLLRRGNSKRASPSFALSQKEKTMPSCNDKRFIVERSGSKAQGFEVPAHLAWSCVRTTTTGAHHAGNVPPSAEATLQQPLSLHALLVVPFKQAAPLTLSLSLGAAPRADVQGD